MENIRIALIHCPNSLTYKLIRLTDELDLNDPCIMWVFDASKMKTAQKIMKNMNVAQVLNMTDLEMAIA